MKFLTWSFLLLAMVALSRAAAAAGTTEAPEKEKTNEKDSTDEPEKEESDSEEEEEEEESSKDAEEKEAGNSTETEGEKHVVKRALRCPGGWRRYGRRCFRYFPRRYTWAQAEKYCQVYSGNLASVQNLYEFRAIQGVAYGRNPQGPAAWIGGSAAEQNGYWFWSDGSRFRYASWCRGKPKNRSGQECIRLNFKNCKTRCMDDANCRSRNPFICARKTY